MWGGTQTPKKYIGTKHMICLRSCIGIYMVYRGFMQVCLYGCIGYDQDYKVLYRDCYGLGRLTWFYVGVILGFARIIRC